MKNVITGEEIVKIKMMCDYGMSVKDIAKVTGRSTQSIYRIKSGTHEAYKLNHRDAMRKKAAALKEMVTTDSITKAVTIGAKDFVHDEQGNYTEVLLNAILMQLTQL